MGINLNPTPAYTPAERRLLSESLSSYRHRPSPEVEEQIQAIYSQAASKVKGSTIYQARDWRIIDYMPTLIDGIDWSIRGPMPRSVESANYFITLGAAESHGTTSFITYGSLLSQLTGLSHINLSIGGASPEFYSKQTDQFLQTLLSEAKFCIMSTTSLRSISNSRLRLNGQGWGTDLKSPKGGFIHSMEVYKQLLEDDPKQLMLLLEESAELYIDYLSRLFEAIDRPVIKLWLSRKALEATSICELAKDSPAKKHLLSSVFPMFSDANLFHRSVQMLKRCSDLSAGLDVSYPSKAHHAVNRFTGAPENWWVGLKQGYYPSTQMHLNACEVIYAYLADSGIVN